MRDEEDEETKMVRMVEQSSLVGCRVHSGASELVVI